MKEEEKKIIKVHYYCDSDGDHTANLADCITNKTKKFNYSEYKLMLKFVDECTQVINLDELLDVVPQSKLVNKELLDSTEF